MESDVHMYEWGMSLWNQMCIMYEWGVFNGIRCAYV